MPQDLEKGEAEGFFKRFLRRREIGSDTCDCLDVKVCS